MFGHCGLLFGRMFMMIIPFVIIALIVFIAFKMLKKDMVRDPHDNADTQRALSILDERFAKGEISEEEYNQKKEMIRRK